MRLTGLQRERVEAIMKEEREQGIGHPNLSRELQSIAVLAKVLSKEKGISH